MKVTTEILKREIYKNGNFTTLIIHLEQEFEKELVGNAKELVIAMLMEAIKDPKYSKNPL